MRDPLSETSEKKRAVQPQLAALVSRIPGLLDSSLSILDFSTLSTLDPLETRRGQEDARSLCERATGGDFNISISCQK
jgi:hypothetical protein